MKLTTQRPQGDGLWRVAINGKPTRLFVAKSEEKKWGQKQLWSILHHTDYDFPWPIADGCESKWEALDAIEKIFAAIDEAKNSESKGDD